MSKILVAGSRSFDNYELMCKVLDSLVPNYPDLEIVTGGSIGADRMADTYAQSRNIPQKIFKADWDGLGKKAGYVRNRTMQEYIAQDSNRLCVAFWDGESPGTRHNFDLVKEYGTNLCVVNLKTFKLTYHYTKQGIKRDFPLWRLIHGN